MYCTSHTYAYNIRTYLSVSLHSPCHSLYCIEEGPVAELSETYSLTLLHPISSVVTHLDHYVIYFITNDFIIVQSLHLLFRK